MDRKASSTTRSCILCGKRYKRQPRALPVRVAADLECCPKCIEKLERARMMVRDADEHILFARQRAQLRSQRR